MNKRTRRPSLWKLAFLVILIGIFLYINQVVVPATPPLFIPTATMTRSPESIINQAEDLYLSGKINQAITAYKEAILSDPTNPANYVALARLQVMVGDYDEAIKNSQNALLKNPNNPLAHAVMGWALGYQEKYGEAEIEIKKAINLDPSNALAYAFLAEILTIQNDYTLYDQASEASKNGLQLGPELMETHRARGIVLLNTQNLEEALQEFETAMTINKNIPDLNLYLGITYKALGEYDQAQEALLAAYALNPTDTVALTELSRAFFGDGRYPQAAQYAEEAVKVDPADARLHGNLGIIYYRQEDFAKAIDTLSVAVHGGTVEDGSVVEGLPLDYGRIEEYYWYYGFALARLNRCSEAVPVFQALLNGVPNDEIAIYNATEGLAMCQQALTGPPQGSETATEASPPIETPSAEVTPSP